MYIITLIVQIRHKSLVLILVAIINFYFIILFCDCIYFYSRIILSTSPKSSVSIINDPLVYCSDKCTSSILPYSSWCWENTIYFVWFYLTTAPATIRCGFFFNSFSKVIPRCARLASWRTLKSIRFIAPRCVTIIMESESFTSSVITT